VLLKIIDRGVIMKNKPIFALALVLLLIIHVIGYGDEYRDHDVIEQKAKGYINWSKGIVQAKGIGTLSKKLHGYVNDSSTALKDAKQDAYLKIFEVVKGIRIDGTTVVGDYAAENNVIISKIEGIVKNAKVVKKEYFSDGTVEVTMEMNFKGGFAQLVLPGEIRPLESIKPMAPVKNSSSVFTGLVVDARGLGSKPVMSPKILDETGQEVYGSAFVSREYAVQQGMSGYSKDLTAAKSNQRVAGNPLTVKGLRIEGTGHSDIVISNADASRLRSAFENLSFMRKCRVIIVVE
jgi:hypothetical protein